MRYFMLTMLGVCGLTFTGVLFAADAKEDAKKETKKFQGTWTLTSGEAEGKALTDKQIADGKLVIEGDHYTVTIPDVGTITGIQKLDPTTTPKNIDIMDDSGPNKGKTCLGIYEIKGAKFRCVFAPAGKDRPTKFATTADSGQWLHVWEKAK